MNDQPETTLMTHVLLVDDNRNYREAFRRNLILEGYEVDEAEDSEEAMDILGRERPDVIVTDLSMRYPTEGLDLIRQIRASSPHMPIIMISAVGTFEEGAEATRMGAQFVISKSKIDEEIDTLFRAIDQAAEEHRQSLRYVARLDQLAQQAADRHDEVQSEVRRIVRDPNAPETVKSVAFDMLLQLETAEQRQATRAEFDRVRAAAAAQDLFAMADANLESGLSDYDALDPETREALRSAEFLFVHGEQIERTVDFSRSVGFSYCFAVENEAKARLRKRLSRFLGDPQTFKLIEGLLENNRKSLSLFYHQYLLRLQREFPMDVTIDNVYQTFLRILEHRDRYKPDGLKALGIVLMCFGRSYEFRKFNKLFLIDNPLGLRGLADGGKVIELAMLLTNLQHFRNPYIHPEISEMEKITKIRETAFECLNLLIKLN